MLRHQGCFFLGVFLPVFTGFAGKAGGKKAGGLFKPVEKSRWLFSYRPLPVEKSQWLFSYRWDKSSSGAFKPVKTGRKGFEKAFQPAKKAFGLFLPVFNRFLTGKGRQKRVFRPFSAGERGSLPAFAGVAGKSRQKPVGKKAGGLFKPVEKSQRLFLTGGIKAPLELLNRLKPAGKAFSKPFRRLKRPSAFFCRFLTGFSPAKAGKKGPKALFRRRMPARKALEKPFRPPLPAKPAKAGKDRLKTP